jgi:uncharacterized membrane protein
MTKFKSEIERVNGYLREIVTFFDDSGKAVGHVMNPLMVELKPRDIMQIFIGSLMVSAPLCFTEEVWNLSVSLKMNNVYLMIVLSVFTVSAFVYFNFYRFRLKGHVINFIKRIVATYVISTLSVVLVLFLIDKLPYATEPMVAFKRIVIIGFPSIFAATIADYIK